jgi:hypothetical protein
MILFKKVITEKNNRELRDRYFSHKFIRRIWPVIRLHITQEMMFKNGLPEIKFKDANDQNKETKNKSTYILPTYYIINYEMKLRHL